MVQIIYKYSNILILLGLKVPKRRHRITGIRFVEIEIIY